MTTRAQSSRLPGTRSATVDDLAVVARIHKAAYSRSHFTSLLSEAVLQRYYSGFLSGGTEIRLALDEASETVTGFSVFGTGIPEKIAAFKTACARDIVATSLRHPWTATRKAAKAGLARLGRHRPYPPAEFLLLSIAVAKPLGGVGKALLRDLLEAAKDRGHETVGLYVNEDNIRAINAYFAAAFRIKDFQDGQFYMEADIAR